MPTRKTDLLLNPIRLRIVVAVSSQQVTAKEISRALSDIPQTTLYRHINKLTEGGILKVVKENQVRGTLERVYALAEIPSLAQADLQQMNRQDYEHAFNAFLTTCMSDAKHYLDTKAKDEPIDLQADGVMVSKIQVWLSDEEFTGFNQQITRLILSAAGNPPDATRKPRVLTYLVIPA